MLRFDNCNWWAEGNRVWQLMGIEIALWGLILALRGIQAGAA